MFCSKCGAQNAPEAAFCPTCGNPINSQTAGVFQPPSSLSASGTETNYGNYGSSAPTSGLAVAALVLAFFVPLVGLILGYSARKDIKNSVGAKSGDGLATAAIVLGWIFTILGALFGILYVVYFASLASNYYY